MWQIALKAQSVLRTNETTMSTTLFKKTAALLLVAGVLAPSMALADTSSVAGNASTTPTQRSCMQTAVSVKSDAQIAALDTLFASLRAAYVTRKNATIAAWGNADGTARVQAIVAANTAFAASLKTSWKSFRDSRHSSEATFKASAAACGIEKEKKESKSRKEDKRNDDDHDEKRNHGLGKFKFELGMFR